MVSTFASGLRRRRWRAEDKGRIVAESYAPGAVVSEAARRHDITPQHLFAWRKAARAGRLTLPAEERPCSCRLFRRSARLARRARLPMGLHIDRDQDCGGGGSRGKRC
jgi:transposase-like protein